MGNTTSDDSPELRATSCLMPMKKKKLDLVLQASKNSLTCKTLKSLTLAVLQNYSDEKLLQDYTSSLKKFTETYDETKFSTFLDNFSNFQMKEQNGLKQTTKISQINSKSTVDCCEEGHELMDEELPCSKSCSSLDKEFKLQSSQQLNKGQTSTKKLTQFLDIETARKDNFFYEFANTFGDRFAAKYEESLQYFKKELQSIKKKDEKPKKKPSSGEKRKLKLKEDVMVKYKEAKLDLKRFQSVLYDLFKGFITLLRTNIRNGNALDIGREAIEKLALKVLFGKNKCYKIYFKFLKYRTRDEEALLKKTSAEVKGLKLKDFNLNPQFCLEGKAKPYQNVIDSLNYINTYTNPFDKYEMIFVTRKQIAKEVDEYYKEEPDKMNVELTADTMIPIYSYCLANGANVKMRRHQLFMEDFLDGEMVKFGDKSYYFITFVASIHFLMSMAGDSTNRLKEYTN